MTPARRSTLALYALLAACIPVGLAGWTLLFAAIGPWWCLGIAAFALLAGVQLWRIAAGTIRIGGAR